MTTKKRLGRGLDALLGASRQSSKIVDGKRDLSPTLKNVPIEHLQRGQYQPRSDMRKESLEELAASIKSQGIIQPIVIRELEHNKAGVKYEIIAGERRWRAAQIAGLSEVPTVIKDVSDTETIAMSLIENIQREDLNPMEEALALNRLIKEFNLTHQEAAKAVGRSRVSVSNLVRLIELPEKVASLLIERKIDMGHARALLALDNLSQQVGVAMLVVKQNLSVRATENYIRNIGKKLGRKKNSSESLNPDVHRLEVSIAEKIGAKLQIKHKTNGNGQIIINYNSLDELEGIIEHIK
jgi:ParB family chromosome partitioning protein